MVLTRTVCVLFVEVVMELLCPAGSLQALRAALDNGADAIYIGFHGQTNARHFSGLNLSPQEVKAAAELVHKCRRKFHVAINTFAHSAHWSNWTDAVDQAVEAGADALIIADISILDYAASRYPHVERHLSVQASATNAAAIEFYRKEFGVKRVVLPRVLSMQHVSSLSKLVIADLEVFAFGSLCIMAEGRCYLSSYITGQSPNNYGACSPARFVRWQEKDGRLETRLNNTLIDRFEEHENVGYPTLCKGRFVTGGHRYHTLEEPVSLNSLSLLPRLYRDGIRALKIEGRQRSPAYVAKVTRIWREAIDRVMANPEGYLVSDDWGKTLTALSEGNQTTLGAYHKRWR